MISLESALPFQINAVGTLLSTVFPAFLPRCHWFIEEGSRIIPSLQYDKFMIVSPDGFIRCMGDCDGNCVNRLGVPDGNMALEIKCPFSPIENKMLLPVTYSCPHYYAAQVLSEIKVLNAHRSMVVSCLPETLTMSYLDWSPNMWDRLWRLALEFYDNKNPSMPNQLNDKSKNLHTILKDFVQDNSVLAVKVPTLECVDSKAYEKFANDENPLYRYRDKYPDLYVDVDDVRDHVINCCKSTMCAIQEVHDLERRKATEVLLFLLTDTDREYSKDKPAAVSVAYVLKGKSLKVSTV